MPRTVSKYWNHEAISPFHDPDAPLAAGCIVTHSDLRVWWLTHLCGYRIALEEDTPKPGLLGGIRYRGTWHLHTARSPGRE